MYLINKLYHRGEAQIQAWLDSKKVHIGIQTFEVVRADRVRALLNNEHGVQIMSPHYEMDPGQMKVVPRERWYAAPAKGPDDLEKKV